jgi:AcrR family transcriptional regulator
MRPSSSATTKKREVLSREARIQSILEASQRVFSSRPYDEISIDEIVAEASMSKGLLYHYFSSKRDLYLETLRSVFAKLSQIPQDSQDLHTCLQAFLSYFEQYPALTKMVFRGGIGSDAEAEELLTAYRQRQFTIFLYYAGNNNPDPLVQLALRGWVSFYQEVCFQWLEHRDISREQLLALLEQSLRAIQSLTQEPNMVHPQNPREEDT